MGAGYYATLNRPRRQNSMNSRGNQHLNWAHSRPARTASTAFLTNIGYVGVGAALGAHCRLLLGEVQGKLPPNPCHCASNLFASMAAQLWQYTSKSSALEDCRCQMLFGSSLTVAPMKRKFKNYSPGHNSNSIPGIATCLQNHCSTLSLRNATFIPAYQHL